MIDGLEIRVYSAEMEFQGNVDDESSFQWTRKYYEPGTFELHCPITANNMELLRRGNLVWKRGAVEAGVIESLNLEETSSKAEITAKGRFLSSYMGRRLIRPYYHIENGLVETAMREIFISAAEIPLVSLGEAKGYTEKVTFQATYKNLLTYEEKLAKYSETGFRFRPDFVNKKIIFELYRGKDHTAGQSDRERVVFSDAYGNLSKAEYSENDQTYKTVCYVGGQGEGTDRTYVTAGDDTLTGLERREVFLSATDIQQGDLTADQYKAALMQRGNDELKSDQLSVAISGEVDPNGNFTYGDDYDLGDLVTIEKESFGVSKDLRIVEINEVYENGVFKITPTFGSPLPDAIDWSDM